MSHIHTEPGQHDNTASAYVVRLDGAEPVLILHRHKKLNKYLQFGGHVELDENPWDAVTHELAEESGYTMRQLKILQPNIRLTKIHDAILHPYPAVILTCQFGDMNHYHTDIAYAFITHELPAGTLGEGESADIKVFTALELVALPQQEIPQNVREVGLFILEECLASWSEVDTMEFSS